MDNAITVEHLSKAYHLGTIGTGTLGNDLKRWYARARGKEDPFLKIGESNDRTTKGTSNVVWSLRDISFEIEQGEAIGIIGKNGAGKSTLLKILSRVTGPTEGRLSGNGRVASLLEVGTGFHPELTGEENIFLNGAILGMRKNEIRRRFDEIVQFAGVERYIDTPVKRYSSGMYVRLAFAVAAHLESEILIVDEVLAVGDTEFQKRCLGKMGEMNKGEGRTVLFVSHNMQAVSTLTSKVIFLNNGRKVFEGETNEGIEKYISVSSENDELIYHAKRVSEQPYVSKVKLITSNAHNIHLRGLPMKINFEITAPFKIPSPVFSFQIMNSDGIKVVHVLVTASEKRILEREGLNKLSCFFPELRLYPGHYTLIIHLSDHITKTKYETLQNVCPFEVQIRGEIREYYWRPKEAIYIENAEWLSE